MANLAIFNGLLQPPKSVADYDMQAAQLQGQQLQNTNRGIQNQTATLGNQKTQVDLDRSNQLLALSKGLPAGASDLDRLSAMRNAGFYDQADALSTSLDNRAKSTAAAAKDTASAAETTNKTQNAMKEEFLKVIPMFNTPDDVKSYLAEGVLNKKLTQDQANHMVSSVPTDPAQLPAWQMKAMRLLLTPEQQTKLTTPDANAVLGAQTQTTNNAATNAAHIQGANISAGASISNNRANIAKDYAVAGVNPDGSTQGDTKAMVDAIGQYKVQPPNGMALRNPRMQSILAQVAQQYPDFDATQYGARQVAAKSFSTGKDGQNVQAANTALNHLDTIEQLATAQKNGNYPLFNKLANEIAAQTGQPAPTNLRAAIGMVAPELTKAVVGAGGGVSERADFAHNLNPNGAPAQILQGVGTIKDLLGGRLTETARTYKRTTGRGDFSDSFLSPAAQKVLQARGGADAGNSALHDQADAILRGGK